MPSFLRVTPTAIIITFLNGAGVALLFLSLTLGLTPAELISGWGSHPQDHLNTLAVIWFVLGSGGSLAMYTAFKLLLSIYRGPESDG